MAFYIEFTAMLDIPYRQVSIYVTCRFYLFDWKFPVMKTEINKYQYMREKCTCMHALSQTIEHRLL